MVFFLVGCAAPLSIEKETKVYVFDYSPYIEKGFYFYENFYPTNYTSLASITIDFYPAAYEITIPKVKVAEKEDIYAIPTTENVYWVKDKLDSKEMLSVLYETANGYQANALINFSYSTIEKKIGNITLEGIRIKGVAVKMDISTHRQ